MNESSAVPKRRQLQEDTAASDTSRADQVDRDQQSHASEQQESASNAKATVDDPPAQDSDRADSPSRRQPRPAFSPLPDSLFVGHRLPQIHKVYPIEQLKMPSSGSSATETSSHPSTQGSAEEHAAHDNPSDKCSAQEVTIASCKQCT